MDIETSFAAFVLGLLGAGHCLGMCGGITAALSFAIPDVSSVKRYVLLLGYNLGRISSYTLLGAIAGILSSAVPWAEATPVLRIVAGLLLILMGFYVADWWKVLKVLERLGQNLWRHLQPLSQRLLPVKSFSAAVLLGALWGGLPCGLLYSALVFSLTQESVVGGAWVMFCFGLGTLPAVFAGGIAANGLKAVLQKRQVRWLLGIGFIVFGLWTLWGAVSHSHHHAGNTSQPAMMMDHSQHH